MSNLKNKLFKKIHAHYDPIVNRLLEATYAVHNANRDCDMDYEAWMSKVKCMLEFPSQIDAD